MEGKHDVAATFALRPGGGALSNPFAQASPAHDVVADDAPEGTYTYAIVKSGPGVPSDEVESPATSVEIMILWDETCLHVSHLTPPRSFYVGEQEGRGFKCDYFIPAEKIGATRAPIVIADGSGSIHAVLLPRATGAIELPGQPTMTLQQAIASGRTQPCAELSGAQQVALPPGSKARIEVGGLVFSVSAVNAGRVVAGRFQPDTPGLLFTGLSFAAHAGILGAMAVFMPALSATGEDEISPDQRYLMQQYLQAAAEKEVEDSAPEHLVESQPERASGATGVAAIGEPGSMGNPSAKPTGHRYGVQGPADNPDPHIRRGEALHDAATFGMIGLLSVAGGDPNAPTAPWGRDDSLGNDASSARGNMWGGEIGESFGGSALGLSGIGEGGGGRGEGIGVGVVVGTVGSCGGCTGIGSGLGIRHGTLSGTHRPAAPVFRVGVTNVGGGQLPPEVIQRIVRQNFGRFRLCYESGLRASPSLQGRIAVRFVIGRDGAVSNVGNGGSDLPDAGVVSCVVRAFYGLSFPQPEGGIVTVTYPILFSPGS